MSSDQLHRMWTLHEVDALIHDLKARAAALDPGRQIQAEIAALEKHLEEKGGEAKRLHQEQIDLELLQKTLDAKVEKLNKDLYGGKVVNPREVEAVEKEIAQLKNQKSSHDDRLLELMELVPPAQALAEKIEKRIGQKRQELKAHQQSVLKTKAEIEEAYKAAVARRPAVAGTLPPPLLSRYEDSRKRAHGLAMARIQRDQSCGGCGTMLSERTIQGAKDDKVVMCDNCHRILLHWESVK